MLRQNTTLRVILFFALIICFNDLVADPVPGNYTEEIKKAYQAEEDFYNQTIAAGNTYHIKCSTVCEAYNEAQEKYESVTTTEEVFASKHLSHVISDDIEVYMDDRDVFTIDKHTNIITHAASAVGRVNLKEAILFKKSSQDSLLKSCLVSNAGTENLGGRQVTHFQLTPRSRDNKYTSVAFYIEPQTYVFRKMLFVVNPEMGKQVKSYNINILERNSMTGADKFMNLRKMFLNDNGTLRKPYNRFHLSDLTVSKR